MKIITIEERVYKIKDGDFKLLAISEKMCHDDEKSSSIYRGQLEYIEQNYKPLFTLENGYRYP